MRVIGLLCLFGCVAPAWADLTVQVVDPSGAPVPAATVVILDASGLELDSGVTSLEGEVKLADGGVEGEVRAEGFEAASVAVRGRAVITVELSLVPVEGYVEVTESIATVTPVASEVIQPQAAAQPDLVDSLRDAPHVQVLRRGGTNFEPVVQGLRETQLAMLVDGTRTFAAGPARMDSELSHVEPGHVNSVEVITGPYALTEGAGAMAAILVTSTPIVKAGDWRFDGRGGIGWRSNGSGRAGHSRVSAGNARVGFSLRAGGDLQDDYSAGGSGAERGALVQGDAASHQLGASLRFNPFDDQEITVSGFYDEQTGVDYPGRLLTAEHFLLRAWRASYRLAKPEGLVSALKLTGYVNKKSHRMSNRGKPTAMDAPGRKPPFALDVSLPAEADTSGGSGSVELSPGKSWHLQAGFDFFRLEQDAQRYIARASDRKLLFSDAVWAGTSLSDVGIYWLAGRSFDQGEIRAAVRVDFAGSDAGRPSEFFLGNSSGALDRSETNGNFSLAGRYDLAGGVTFSAGMGRVMRTANALERYSDRFPSTRFQVAAEFMGNPAIRPESSTQGDLSIEWKKGTFAFSAGGYVRSLGDYITVRPDPSLNKRLPLSPAVVFRYVNGESAFFRGWHFGVRRVGERVEFRSRVHKTLADDRELMQPVLGIAPMEVDSTLRWNSSSGRFWGQYRIRNVWDQRRVSAARIETSSPGFTIHGTRFGAKLWAGAGSEMDLHLGLENLGDKLYYEHLNSLNPFTRQRIPEMGRSFVVALVTTW